MPKIFVVADGAPATDKGRTTALPATLAKALDEAAGSMRGSNDFATFPMESQGSAPWGSLTLRGF